MTLIRSIRLLAGLAPVMALSMITHSGAAHADDIRSQLLEESRRRGLSSSDILAAASTYTPTGKKDEFICLNSGGQAGSLIAYGVPSMRILKYVPTTSPDSSTGFDFDDQSQAILNQGDIEGQELTWGDTHHPGFSETEGKYDGRWAFINDKANPRLFVVDLRDFETKQIVTNPIFRSDHGGAFVTPNTEYVIEGSQYPAPPDRKYRPLNQESFNKHYRGGLTFHKFDKEKGRLLSEGSFTIIAPPYSQDLSDAGKGESYGFSFTNSFCAERYATGFAEGQPPYEAGCSAKDTDYLHVVDWKRAEQIVAAGKTKKINGHTVIPLEVAAAEGVLFLIPEPKSPHGADVSPDGRYIVVAGKLDTHATVYDIRKIKELINKKDFIAKDPYGVPILDLQKSIHGQVELGLGPLHTQFDSKKGIAYTSVYIDSVVVKWDFLNLKVLDKVSVHYNIGHLVAMQGDTQEPSGKYLIALNKLAIDRFDSVGPLHPQNHQLIDISGEKMRVIYDLPLPMGEPHYTVCIDAAKVSPALVYAPGTDAATMSKSEVATERGKERIKRKSGLVEVFGTVAIDGILPLQIDAKQGDTVRFHLTNIEQTPGRIMRFNVDGYNALGILPPGKVATVSFTASQAGRFNYRSEGVDSEFAGRVFGALSVAPVSLAEAGRKSRHERWKRERAKLAQIPDQERSRAPLAPGQAEFESYGCGGCHAIGREAGGPDLTDVLARRDRAWLSAWIQSPEMYYDDPSIAALIKRFGVKMPNQNVSPEDAEKIIDYLATLKSTPAATTGNSAGDSTSGPIPEAYSKMCFACHDSGVGGAPKIGDQTVWAERIAQGNEALYKHALEGYQGKTGYMPPKGGCMDCSDEQVKAAVDYLKSKVK